MSVQSGSQFLTFPMPVSKPAHSWKPLGLIFPGLCLCFHVGFLREYHKNKAGGIRC